MILGWLSVLILVAIAAALATRWWQRNDPLPMPAAQWLEDRAGRSPLRVAGLNAPLVAVRSVRRAIDVRVTGLAAEMTYYALISLVPLAGVLGSALGFVDRIIGQQRANQLETALVDAVGSVFADDIAENIMIPMIEGIVHQKRAGLAIGSLVVTLWLASRVFRAAVRALDDAYRVTRRRTFAQQAGLGIVLSASAIAAVLVLLSLAVADPLFGDQQLLRQLSRWPVVLVICMVFLTMLYRFGPHVSQSRRQCWPGAALGAVALLVTAWGFRIYVSVAGPRVPELSDATQAADTAMQVLGVVLAGVLWMWVSSIIVLAGGVLNAEIAEERRLRDPA